MIEMEGNMCGANNTYPRYYPIVEIRHTDGRKDETVESMRYFNKEGAIFIFQDYDLNEQTWKKSKIIGRSCRIVYEDGRERTVPVHKETIFTINDG